METTEKTVVIQGKEMTIEDGYPVRVSCAEHVERELDDYVDQYEVAPDTYPIEQVENLDLEKTCMVCGAEGRVVLLRVKEM
ncbi:CxxH/CxxC protein [Brevibacillus humidisoli]|uniref:CxxH/CxxC protein n=1 Tax=Brevibacillus humidisoli TaxID=2895522 RepID=UPI001E4C5C6A|nr:CxxH/CxxC protein [Brevibacillus humidisoli]UFJ40410.1 CxxH/CxxC protein [Brevibacillus humidisoli]